MVFLWYWLGIDRIAPFHVWWNHVWSIGFMLIKLGRKWKWKEEWIKTKVKLMFMRLFERSSKSLSRQTLFSWIENLLNSLTLFFFSFAAKGVRVDLNWRQEQVWTLEQISVAFNVSGRKSKREEREREEKERGRDVWWNTFHVYVYRSQEFSFLFTSRFFSLRFSFVRFPSTWSISFLFSSSFLRDCVTQLFCIWELKKEKKKGREKSK